MSGTTARARNAVPHGWRDCPSCGDAARVHGDAGDLWCELHGFYYRRPCLECSSRATFEPDGRDGPAFCDAHRPGHLPAGVRAVPGSGSPGHQNLERRAVPTYRGRAISSELRELLDRSVAPSTLRAYEAAITAWEAWARGREVSALPADPHDVAEWVAVRAATVGTSSLRQAVAALNAVHAHAGHEPPGHDPIVRRALRGAARGGAVPKRGPSRPLLARDLCRMFDALDRDDPRDVRDRALLLVAWLGALRRSEVSALDVGDAVAVPQGIELTIRRDKTNQSGPPRVLGLARQAPPYCPVEALERWRAVLTAHGVDDGPLWRQLVAGRPAGRLSDRAVYDRVQAAARRAQLVASWGAHSMRSGALTEGANAGVPLDRLREHGRHASIDQTLAYVRPDIWTGNATFGLLAGRRVR